ncbi:MAG: class I SAM-dependent methyltransferase [bacterium]|nr:class I SAM-dependent methyltransferase [bacterium]
MLSQRNCPVCKNNNNVFFVKKNSHDIYRCTQCKLLFVWPLPGRARLTTIYSSEYFGGNYDFGYMDYDVDKTAMHGTFNVYLDIIEQHQKNRGALFDIGAATGYFMEIAQKRGWKASGVEISEYAAQVGLKKGLDIQVGTVADIADAKERFDAITMWDVIEHMGNPESSLQDVRRLLKTGGVVAINTPDAGSMVAKIFGKRWHALVPPEHLHYFNAQNLGQLLERNNFEVLAVHKVAKKFTLPYVFKVLAHWQGLSLWNYLASALKDTFIGAIAIPINLRDNFLIIARKKA